MVVDVGWILQIFALMFLNYQLISEKMLKFHHVLLIIALIMVRTSSATVPCPNATQFQNCYTCFQYTPLSPIRCVCNSQQFSILGRCIAAPYPCDASFIILTIIDHPSFPQSNLWGPIIAPFWTDKLQEAKNHTAEPNPLPQILNDYNFTNMTNRVKIGWVEAYFMYQAYKTQIQSWPLNKQYASLFQAIVLMQNLTGLGNNQKWANVTDFVNQKLNKNYSVSELRIQTSERVRPIAPCQRCGDMYSLIIENNIGRCSKCSPNCKNCTNNTAVCMNCQPETYMSSNGTCQVCPWTNCQTCNQTQCFTCVKGYSLVGGKCQQCQGGCVNCVAESPTICTTCTFVFYGQTPKSNGQCVVCAPQCYDCTPTNTTNCTQCHEFFYLDSNFTCRPCPQNCMKCIEEGCVECTYGYGVVNGTCQACTTPGCISCNGFVEACTACIVPFFDFNYTSGQCQLTNATSQIKDYRFEQIPCRAGCDYCFNNDTSKCFKCHDRYFTKDSFYCQKCMSGCLQCVNSTKCLTPLIGYVVVSNGVSVKCPVNCRQCSSTNTSKCLYCRQGYQLVNQVCVPNNRPECLVFDDVKTNQCSICMPGYALTQAKICIQCVSGCKWTCNPQNISECRRTRFELGGWFLYEFNLGNQGCYGQVQGSCLQPEEGYKIIQNNQTKIFEVTLECLYPCATCNSTACFSCEDGYTFSNGRCDVNFSCNPNCTQCVAGSERNPANNFCMACPVENCSSCQNGVCFECFEGFFFNGTACVKCPPKCRVCYDADNCNICAVGYLWPAQFRDYSYDCVKCSDNCKTCKFQPNTCTQCHPGLKLVNFRCRKQFHLDFTYTLDYDYASFVVNMKSEVLIGFFMRALGVGYEDIFISSIKSGSTIISGEISGINEDSARNLYNKLKATELTDFKVKGYSISFKNDQVTVKCISKGTAECPHGTEEGLSAGAIAGIVIGCIFGVILIIIGIACCLKHRKGKTTKGSEQDIIQIKSQSVKTGSGFQSETNLHKGFD